MPFGYPVLLELADRRCVVIGATAVREGKVDGLLLAGATDVLVVAPGQVEIDPDPRVRVEGRRWAPDDLDGAFLCVASSDDAIERAAIAREARARGVLVNVMDDVPSCDWAAPAVVRRGELVFAISTGGASPALTKKLRRLVSEAFGDEWGGVLAVLRAVREETLPLLPDVGERARRWSAALDLFEAEALVREGRSDELRERLLERMLGVREATP